MKRLYFISILIIIQVVCFSLLHGQPPSPPNEHGLNQNQPAGNGAPIGTGMALMTGLFTAYGAKKLRDIRKKPEA